MDWRDEALCRNEDPELFFPIGAGIAVDRQVEEATAVCFRCTVRGACLDWAMDMDERTSGIWGGTTEDERRALHKAEQRERERERAGG